MDCKRKEYKLNWQRKDRKINKDRYREYRKKAYIRHKDKILAYSKKWKAKNKKKVREYMRKFNKEYYQKNKEKLFCRIAHRIYLIQLMIERDGGCHKCGTIDNLTIHHKKYTLDVEDLILLCNSCHQKIHLKER